MQKWKYVRELDDHNPVCFDLGNIEGFLPYSGGHTPNWVPQRWNSVPWIGTIMADGKEYHLCGEKKYITLMCGQILMKVESGTGYKEFDKEPDKNEFFDLEDFEGIRVCGRVFDQAVCSDLRILYLHNKLVENWKAKNQEYDQEYELSSKIEKAGELGNKKEKIRLEKELDKLCRDKWTQLISNIPSMEDALQWLHERDYQSTPVDLYSDIAQKKLEKYYNNEYEYLQD